MDILLPHPPPKLSLVVVCFNMAREIPRTIQSLSPPYQIGVNSDDYEVILMDNGSTEPFDEREVRRLLPGIRIYRVEDAGASPVRAINQGISLARGDLIGVCIDGARMASPGLLSKALASARLHPRPIIGTLGFHLGPDVQPESMKRGYTQAVEDTLLNKSAWQSDGYRLFSVSVFALSAAGGWFRVPSESNAFFLTARHWRDLGYWDERFSTPGGGLANLDMWARVCADSDAELVMLLGEATFHQFHGGIATNNLDAPHHLFSAEFEQIRGRAYEMPRRKATYFGSFPASAEASLAYSLRQVLQPN